MTILNKIKWVISVIVVFLLILATNLIDQDNFDKVKQSVEKIYQDQLLTKQRVLELSIIMHDKEIELIKDDSAYYASNKTNVNNHIKALIDSCSAAAKNQKVETLLFEMLENARNLFELEKDTASKEKILMQLELIHQNIKEISEFQVEEGRREKIRSRDALASSKLFANIEIYLLIALGLIIQFVLLYQPKKSKTEDEMNQ